MLRRKAVSPFRRAPGFLLLGVVGATALLAACEEDAAPDFGVVISIVQNKTTIKLDGSDTTIAQVSVIDDNGNSVGPGEVVKLLADPQGIAKVNGQDGPVEAPITADGFAQFTISCNAAGTFGLFGLYEDKRARFETTLECKPFDNSNWTLAVTADPRRVTTGGNTAITVFASDLVDGQSTPLVNLPIRIEVTGETARLSSGSTAQVYRSNREGRVTAAVAAGSTQETISICASFQEDGPPDNKRCTSVIVSNTQPREPQCAATLSATRAPADGESRTNLDFFVTDQIGQPVSGASIALSARAGSLLDSAGNPLASPATITTDANGDARALIQSPAEANAAGILATASFPVEGGTANIDCKLASGLVFYPRPVCSIDAITVPTQVGGSGPVMGVKGSGVNEVATLRYCFETIGGEPVPAGSPVDFEFVVQTPGSSLSATAGSTDEAGCVEVQLSSGTIAGQVEVRATYPFGQTESSCVSGPVSIRGVRPVGDWSLSCNPRNVGAVIDSERSDGDVVPLDCNVTCEVILRDRYRNPVNFPGVQVFFSAEQGTIASPRTPDENGRVVTTYNPNGLKPRDVAPLAGEPFVRTANNQRTYNPRDMVVTITAWTQGLENFDDLNGNGAWDQGEVFDDLGEPLFDYDDNDRFDGASGDQFIDIATANRAANGTYDGPNGQWDADTVIWTHSRVVITGAPELEPAGPPLYQAGSVFPEFFSYMRYADFCAPGVGNSFQSLAFPEFEASLRCGVGLRFADRYLNAINQTAAVSASFAGDCPGGRINPVVRAGDPAYGFDFNLVTVGYNAANQVAAPGEPIVSRRRETRMTNFTAGREFIVSGNVNQTCAVNATLSYSVGATCSSFSVAEVYSFPVGSL